MIKFKKIYFVFLAIGSLFFAKQAMAATPIIDGNNTTDYLVASSTEGSGYLIEYGAYIAVIITIAIFAIILLRKKTK
jgi:hypothetical protein